jgi:hypothetical protein
LELGDFDQLLQNALGIRETERRLRLNSFRATSRTSQLPEWAILLLTKLNVGTGDSVKRINFFLAACLAMALGNVAQAEPIPVRHVQRPMHEFMVARSETDAVLARSNFRRSYKAMK